MHSYWRSMLGVASAESSSAESPSVTILNHPIKDETFLFPGLELYYLLRAFDTMCLIFVDEINYWRVPVRPNFGLPYRDSLQWLWMMRIFTDLYWMTVIAHFISDVRHLQKSIQLTLTMAHGGILVFPETHRFAGLVTFLLAYWQNAAPAWRY